MSPSEFVARLTERRDRLAADLARAGAERAYTDELRADLEHAERALREALLGA